MIMISEVTDYFNLKYLNDPIIRIFVKFTDFYLSIEGIIQQNKL